MYSIGSVALPADCPLYDKRDAKCEDAWHFSTCTAVKTREVTSRPDEVVNVLYRFALMKGIQAMREPAGLHASDERCPDLQLLLPGCHILSDVCIMHPYAPAQVHRSCSTLGAARQQQGIKHRKYSRTAAQERAELLPFVVETSGGMASDAVQLLAAMVGWCSLQRCECCDAACAGLTQNNRQTMGDMGEHELAVWPSHVMCGS